MRASGRALAEGIPWEAGQGGTSGSLLCPLLTSTRWEGELGQLWSRGSLEKSIQPSSLNASLLTVFPHWSGGPAPARRLCKGSPSRI